MSNPRRRTFGPLFYSTLVLAILIGGYSVVLRLASMLNDWQEVRSLVQMLRSAHPGSREKAAMLLAQRGPELHVPILLEAAQDARGEIRVTACRSLVNAQTQPSVVIPILITAAKDQQDEVRIEAASDLARVAEYSSRTFVRQDGSGGGLAADLRRSCAQALRRLLKDRSLLVRAEAASALAVYGSDPSVASELIMALDDEDRYVRFAAARAVMKLNGANDPRATQTLIALVSDPDAVPDRRAVMEVLCKMSDDVQDQAVAALRRVLTQGDPIVLPDVIDCLSDAGIRAHSVVPALEHLFNDNDSELRGRAGMAIVAIEGQASPRAIEVLVRMVADPAIPQSDRESAIAWLRGGEVGFIGEAYSRLDPTTRG